MISFGLGVHLTTIEEEDLSAMRKARNDFSTWKWARQPALISERAHRDWYEWQAKDPNTKMYAIRNQNDQFVGVCGFSGIDWLNQRGEFSIYIRAEHRSNRYATSALRTLFTHGFRDLNFHLIWGETFDGNIALEVFKKIGMQHDGLRRDFYFKDGKFLDAHLVSVKRDEWKTLQRS